VTLSIIELRSVGWSTVRALNNGYFGVFLGSLKGVSGLRNGSLALSVTVGLEAARIGTRCVYVEGGRGMLDHSGSYQAFRTRRSVPVPALPPYIIEPIWEQFTDLLPEREVNHPLGSTGLSPLPHTRPGSLWEAGSDPGIRLRLPQDRRRGMFGYHTSGPARRVDSMRGDGEAPGNGAGSLRPLHRPGSLGGGRGLLHYQGPLRRREGGQEPGG
jgi:hypothetical protein